MQFLLLVVLWFCYKLNDKYKKSFNKLEANYHKSNVPWMSHIKNFKIFCLKISFNSSLQSLLSIHKNLNKSFLCSVIGEISPYGSKNVALIVNKFCSIIFPLNWLISPKSNTNKSFPMFQLIPNTILKPKKFLPYS